MGTTRTSIGTSTSTSIAASTRLRAGRWAAAAIAALLLTSGVAGCGFRSSQANPTPSDSLSSSNNSTSPSPSTSTPTNPQPSSTATSGTPISLAELQSSIELSRTGAGASVGITGTTSGVSTFTRTFTGNIDVDSGVATGTAANGSATGQQRIIIGSTMYTRTTAKWVAVSLDGAGIPAGDIRLLWSLLGRAVGLRKTALSTGNVITGALPANFVVQDLGQPADASGQLVAAATGSSAQMTVATNSDGFITSVSITAEFNVNGTPTRAALRATLSDYGQIVDARRPVTDPVQTPEGQ